MTQRALRRRVIFHAVLALISVGAAALIAYLTDIISAWGKWYSPSLEYRIQTDALLNGSFAVARSPFGMSYDWAWGDGVQLVGGLGIPFLRLPFEGLARMVGYRGFPDGVIFLLCLALVFYSFFCARNRAASLIAWPVWAMSVLWMVSLPPFVAMLRTRFQWYEEAVAYGVLLALFIFSRLLRRDEPPKRVSRSLTAFLCGIAVLFRPTALAYGAVGFLLLQSTSPKSTWRQRGFESLLFGMGVGGALLTNWIRFGSPLEFGHGLTISAGTLGYTLKWYAPFSHVNAFAAFKELLAWLFAEPALNAYNHYQRGFFPWQVDVPRFRESYFTTFTVSWAVTLVAFWIGWLGVSQRKVVSSIKAQNSDLIKSIWLCWSFSIGSALLLFLFYLRIPGFASRYAIDFFPSFASALFGFVLTLFLAVQRAPSSLIRGGLYGLVLAMIGSWSGWHHGRAEISPQHTKTSRLTAEELPAPLPMNTRDFGPPLPSFYECGAVQNKIPILYHLEGWNQTSCSVKTSMILAFFPRSECLELTLGPSVYREWLDSIAVKNGSETFERVATPNASEVLTVVRFCRAAGTHPIFPKNREDLYFISFVSPANFGVQFVNVELLGIRAIAH